MVHMRVLVFNPGSNSLKFQVVDVSSEAASASAGVSRLSASIENFGDDASLTVISGAAPHEERMVVGDMGEATAKALEWLKLQQLDGQPTLATIQAIGVRVVHGGLYFTGATRYDDKVRRRIEDLEELAPLHNKNSLAIIDAVVGQLKHLPVVTTFDTAFHRTLPEVAWRYPIDRTIADRHGLRKFGFHGVSHHYMASRYAELAGKRMEDVSLVTLHLESGSSACAISNGKSVDTTMGITPLEGLMMGTRSGSVDPALVEILMRKEGVDIDGAMEILNKQSGLKGIGGNLDTRVLAKQDDDSARLALQMFSYRVRLAVGAYLAAVPQVEAVVFGAGIGEDSPAIRAAVCDGLGFAGVALDAAVNENATAGEALLSTPSSRLAVWSMPSQEGLQIARETARVLGSGN